MPDLRILIADDHEIVRQGLRSLVESHPGLEVCGEAVDGWDSAHKARELKPDVVALDIGMPNRNGLDATREILRDNPKTKVLFLTIYDTEQAVKTAGPGRGERVDPQVRRRPRASGCRRGGSKELDIFQFPDESNRFAAGPSRQPPIAGEGHTHQAREAGYPATG